jgi:hypothetical protein
VGPINARAMAQPPAFDLVSDHEAYHVLFFMLGFMVIHIYFLDASLGNPIWATADGCPRYSPGLREIGQTLSERSAPNSRLRLQLFETPIVAGYYGVDVGRCEPGRALGRDALGEFADR